MKVVLVIMLLSLFLHAHCSPLTRPDQKEESQMELGQKRSARVHRVAENEFPGNEESDIKSRVNEVTSTRTSSGNQKVEKFVDSNGSTQRVAEMFRELKVILKELSRDGTIALKNIDLAISGLVDATTSATPIKSTSKSDSVLKNLLNSPEELDIYYPDGQDVEKEAKSKSSSSPVESMNSAELKTAKTIAQYLNKVLLEVQNHIIYIRNVFEKLCRKHRSTSSAQSKVDNSEKLTSSNQPKKVSIL